MSFLGLDYEQLLKDYGPEVGLALVVFTIVGIAIGLFIIYIKNYKLFHVYVNAYVDKRMQTLEGETMWEFRRYFRPKKCPELPGWATLQFRRSGLPIKEKGQFFFILTWIGEDKVDLHPNTCKRRRSKQRQFHEVITPCYVVEIEVPVTITIRLRPEWTLCNYASLVCVLIMGAVGGPLAGAYYGMLVALIPVLGCVAILGWWLVDAKRHPYSERGYCQYIYVNPSFHKQLVTGFEVKFWDLEQEGGAGTLKKVGELRTLTVSLLKLTHMKKKLDGLSIEVLSVSVNLVDGLPEQIKEDYGTSLLASRSPVGFRSLVRDVMEAKTENSVLQRRMEEFERRAAEEKIKAAEKRGNYFRFLTDALKRITTNTEEVYSRDVGVQSRSDYERTFGAVPIDAETETQRGLAKTLTSLQELMVQVSEQFSSEQASRPDEGEKKGRWPFRRRKK